MFCTSLSCSTAIPILLDSVFNVYLLFLFMIAYPVNKKVRYSHDEKSKIPFSYMLYAYSVKGMYGKSDEYCHNKLI